MLTPYLAVDLDSLEQNINTMAELASKMGIRVRPHFKTHKSTDIALLQLAAGAAGITCATLGEAEVVAESGIRDILISREVVGPAKLARLAKLAQLADVKVVVDNPSQVINLGAVMESYKTHLGVLIEINIGQNRCGMDPGQWNEILSTLQLIEHNQFLTFRGFQGYEGHLVLLPNERERTDKTREANALLIKVANGAREAGYPAEIVTGGGTGTALITGSIRGMTEIQPGTYATMDAVYSKIVGNLFVPAVEVITTVISKPSVDRLVIDAGSKAISTDYGVPEVVDHPDWIYHAAGDEYGVLSSADGGPIAGEVGDEMGLYPSHGCTTFNLYDRLYCFRRGKLEKELGIAGRGKSY